MFKKNIIFLLLVFLSTSLCSCGVKTGSSLTSGSTIETKLSLIDISGAKALMVLPSETRSSAKKSSERSSLNRFVKMLANGTIEEIAVEDVHGNAAMKIPTDIFDASNDYMIIVVENNPYLVSKVDGKAYDLNPVGTPTVLSADTGLSESRRQNIFSDLNGNLYYLASGRVKKIDVTNPDRITAQSYTSDTDSADAFAVDRDGNTLYSIFGGKRIKKANGGLYNLPEVGARFYFRGLDGRLYFQGSSSDSLQIQKINFDGSYNVSFSNYGNSINPGFVYYDYQYNWLYFPDRILMICDSSFEVYNPANQPRVISLPFLAYTKRKIIKNSTSFYYVATKQGALIKVNPLDDSYVTLINENEYDYYKMEVTNNDIVIFNALRMSDGKKVLGQVSASGGITIVDDTLTSDVVILRRVN